jgi:hypothetical protein
MAKGVNAIQGAIIAHWDKIKEHIGRVHSGSQFSPGDGYAVFKVDYASTTAEEIVITVGPVVINLPERANHHATDLFVVAEGKLNFNLTAFNETGRLVSCGYASHVGYFKRAHETLEHVYGVHYDFDIDRPAHPVFHAQFKSFGQEFIPHLQELCQLTLPLVDRMSGMLQNIRLPIAQLDFFSVIIQLAADHLMWVDSTSDERNTFNEIVKLDHAIMGASTVAPWLTQGAALPCHRAIHWYAPLAPAP